MRTVVDFAASRQIDPSAYNSHDRRIVVGLQKREHFGVGAAQSIVKGQQDCFTRQRSMSDARIDQLLQADDVITMRRQPIKMSGQVARAGRVLLRIKRGANTLRDNRGRSGKGAILD